MRREKGFRHTRESRRIERDYPPISTKDIPSTRATRRSVGLLPSKALARRSRRWRCANSRNSAGKGGRHQQVGGPAECGQTAISAERPFLRNVAAKTSSASSDAEAALGLHAYSRHGTSRGRCSSQRITSTSGWLPAFGVRSASIAMAMPGLASGEGSRTKGTSATPSAGGMPGASDHARLSL